MKSLWNDSVKAERFTPMLGDRYADVLIIGGGMAGILCAYRLQQQGVDCLLLEADRIGSGTTHGTTAKITAQHGLCYRKLLTRYGVDVARGYYDANTSAIEQYRRLAADIPCDFVTMNNLIYSQRSEAIIDRELEALDKIGRPASLAEKLSLPFPTKGAVKFAKQASFHPLKFLMGIARHLSICEQTPVLRIDGRTAYTPHGKVTADKIIIATHFPFLNARGLYWMRLHQSRSYVIALKNAPAHTDMYMDEREDGLSFRPYGDYLLVGGGGKRTGKPCGGFEPLECFATEQYPTSEVVYRWAAQDCMSLDGIPYIGQYAAGLPHLFVATGFNKWGMTSAMVAANLLTDLILEHPNPAAAVFSPMRTPVLLPLAANIGASTIGMLTPTLHRCTHLGCGLHYNRHEHSWDCPCHGSRYGTDGHVLEGPAKHAHKPFEKHP